MKTHQTNWSTNYIFLAVLAQAIFLWITENENVVKKLKVTLKIRENTSNKFKLTYFWRVLGVWNHCAQRPPMQSTNSLRKSVTIDWTWKFWNVHIDAICLLVLIFSSFFLKNFSPLSPSICCSIHTIDRKYEIDSLFSSHSYPDIYLLLVIENISG